MIFNSIPFAVFFSLFFVLYWLVFNKNLRLQNLLILVASYVFYAWWDWRFLFLLIVSTCIVYFLGIRIAEGKTEKTKKIYLGVGLFYGVGLLVVFKYFNFFIETFQQAFEAANIHLNLHTLNIILPLGISFYTFRMLSYLFDIHHERISPTYKWEIFFCYIAFFPSLISGPIDRAGLLIPQLEKKRSFDYAQAADGMRQILWGLFKKAVIADNCAGMANTIFADYTNLPASTLLLGAFYFTIQLYADFSGYSDMAIGFSKLIGFNITRNFNYPFLAQNIAEYWRRWHISLTSWLTDYVFTPLSVSFRDYGKIGVILSVIINFTLIGIWHGANWTFVLFGFLHGCYYIPLILRGTLNKRKKIAPDKLIPAFSEVRNMLGTFVLVMLTNVIFRADTVTKAFQYLAGLFSRSIFSYPVKGIPAGIEIIVLPFIGILLVVDWIQRDKEYSLQIENLRTPVRWSIYFFLAMFYLYNTDEATPFMYFQF